MNAPQIVTFVTTDAGCPLTRRALAFTVGEDGELQSWLSGPTADYCRQKLEARVYAERAKGRRDLLGHRRAADPFLAEKLGQMKRAKQAAASG